MPGQTDEERTRSSKSRAQDTFYCTDEDYKAAEMIGKVSRVQLRKKNEENPASNAGQIDEERTRSSKSRAQDTFYCTDEDYETAEMRGTMNKVKKRKEKLWQE